MKAIETRYVGPTNTRGARILVTDGDKRMSIPYPHDLSGDACHWEAVKAFMKDRNWGGTLVPGHTKRGMVFVFSDCCEFQVFKEAR